MIERDEKTALIVVDVQNDFCPGGSLAVADGDKVVEPLNELITVGREKGWTLITTRDWHEEGIPHFETWPIHCLQNSRGGEFHPDLDVRGVEVFSKGTDPAKDGYSGFDGRNAAGLDLEMFLKLRGVERVLVGGLATDYCVKATAIDSAEKGFETYLVFDAAKAVNLKVDDGWRAIEDMVKAGVHLTESKSILDKAV